MPRPSLYFPQRWVLPSRRGRFFNFRRDGPYLYPRAISRLTKARNLEQKAAIEAKFNVGKPAVESGGADEEDEAASKAALLLLKPFIADASVRCASLSSLTTSLFLVTPHSPRGSIRMGCSSKSQVSGYWRSNGMALRGVEPLACQVQSSWDPAEPLGTWRRVKVDPATATHVTGLSLASSGLGGDLSVLAPLFAQLPQLAMLLIQSNPGVTGDLSHLR